MHASAAAIAERARSGERRDGGNDVQSRCACPGAAALRHPK
jgi:hypothetical protein